MTKKHDQIFDDVLSGMGAEQRASKKVHTQLGIQDCVHFHKPCNFLDAQKLEMPTAFYQLKHPYIA